MLLLHDFSNRVIQASKFMLKTVIVKKNSLVLRSLFIIMKLGFIISFVVINFKFIRIRLKYQASQSVIRGLFCVSKNSSNQFIRNKHILKVLQKNFFSLNGFLIVSTNKCSLLLDIECFFYKIGGKALLAIY